MNLRAIDLNLLPVFEAVFTEGGITRAAERLNLTQPDVSNALARLRSVSPAVRVRIAGDRVTGSRQRLAAAIRARLTVPGTQLAVLAREASESRAVRRLSILRLSFEASSQNLNRPTEVTMMYNTLEW